MNNHHLFTHVHALVPGVPEISGARSGYTEDLQLCSTQFSAALRKCCVLIVVIMHADAYNFPSITAMARAEPLSVL